MRWIWTLGLLNLLLAPFPCWAESPTSSKYTIAIDNESVQKQIGQQGGKKELSISFAFKVLKSADGAIATDVNPAEIQVLEDGLPVENLKISQPRAQNLTTMLAIDVSGSMSSNGKIVQAQKASHAFLDRLDDKADTGLILFDHQVPEADPSRLILPAGTPGKFLEHRTRLGLLIDQARPLGGTAYLDAASRAVGILARTEGRKAVLLLTDGVDMSSQKTIEQVIQEANAAHVPVYTLGIGSPGKNEQVSTVLVLDTSGSMRGKANDRDKESKLDALKRATSRFVHFMRPTAKTTLIPFNSRITPPARFSSDKANLISRIEQLRAEGGTLLYDATLAGIETIVAGNLTGRKAVVVLTDGKDESPGSRHSDQEVIDRATEERIPLYMLGLGHSFNINEPIMRRMAEKTDGKYYHAEDENSLIGIFEQLSIDLHDDGIDEQSLKNLAEKTGGKYYPARNASLLAKIYEELAIDLQSSYSVTFRSRKQNHDGTARGIDVRVIRGGVAVSNVGQVDYTVPGVVVVPEMNRQTYLVFFAFLAGLLFLLYLPTRLTRQTNPSSKG